MVDVETDLYDEVARAVLAEHPAAFVSGEHVLAPPSFPALFLECSSNAELASAADSSGDEVAASVTFTASVYSASPDGARAECKAIAQVVDARMRFRNMSRISAQFIDNAADPSVTRFVARYAGVAGSDDYIYRR